MGICGYVKEKNINENVIEEMINSLTDLNNTKKKVYITENTNFGTTNESCIKKINGNTYIILFYGELYNKEELIEIIKSKGFDITESSDSELVLLSYMIFKKEALNLFNGIYSFVIYDKQNDSFFLARDRLGVKPIYYSFFDKFIFSTEIKAMFKHPLSYAKVGKDEICELFGLGPAHTLGKTYFKDIYEIKPGHYGIFDKNGFNEYKYWDLETKDSNESIQDEIKNVKELVVDSLKRESKTDKKICSMLSGGLDSSVLCYLANKEIDNLSTFSIDFDKNKENFKGTDYQPSRDSDYVEIMKNFLNTNHTNLYFTSEDLFNNLKDVVIARDMPGMADVDSSILVFLRKIKEAGFSVALSGECSDEIFGGYPWYYKNELINSKNFPWSRSINIRKEIINKDIVSGEYLEDYVNNAFKVSSQNVKYNSNDINENLFRRTCYNTVKWFMNTLIERTDRMCLISGLDVRIPYADYRIFEYVYNISYKHKLGLVDGNNEPIEKYLLRKAFESDLPKDVVYRKKSPFPKTYDPEYTLMLENKMKEIINDNTSPILELINVSYLYDLLDSHGENLTENWFGQLMTYPQTLAYLIQINIWLKEYNVNIEI